MNALERLVAAASGRIPDRVPVFCNLLDQGASLLGMSLREYYSNGQHVAEGQLRQRERYGYDNVWSLFYVGKEAELFAPTEIIFAEDGPPNVASFCVKRYEDVHHLEVPKDLASHPAFEEPLRCLRMLVSELKGKAPICAYITASTTLPALLMGMEAWMSLFCFGPAEVRDELIAKCSAVVQAELELFRREGVDVLLYSSPFGSTDFVPRKLIDEITMPWMARDLAPGGPSGVVYYCGSARLNDMIQPVLAQLGIEVYYSSPLEDPAEGKRILAGRGLCCGVINDIALVDLTPEQVRAEVARLMRAGKEGGRYLFGTVLMPMAIPEANIRAMLDAAFEFGTYP